MLAESALAHTKSWRLRFQKIVFLLYDVMIMKLFDKQQIIKIKKPININCTYRVKTGFRGLNEPEEVWAPSRK